MSWLESWLTTQWYARKQPNFLLRVFASIYHQLLRFQKPQNTEKLGAPIIVVGNFTVGGTGKTPLIIAIINYLKQHGFRPGVVSRGYARQSKDPISVMPDTHVRDSGDEPLLISKRVNAPVRVDANRKQAAQFLIQHGCDIIVSDDGLQHRNLPREIEIEVIDEHRGYGNGRLLPAGPLREPVRAVSMQVRNASLVDDEHSFAMQLNMQHCVQLNGTVTRSLTDFSGQSIFALAGIGHPQRFFAALETFNIHVTGIALSDHQLISLADFPAQGTVFVTEKDAVKCADIKRDDVWVVPVHAQLSDRFYTQLMQKILIAQEAV
ncbi:MAG: tetraacyldisaccharide 4'-kinase [Arenimonas sp.]|nr:tetraacyldisaccharide 4'-kinase [Arenimonas sp.]